MAKSRNRRRSASGKRHRTDSIKAVRNIAIIVVLLGLVGTVYYRAIVANRTLNEETLCPVEVEGVTVVLVDVTDPMNTPQRQDFRNQLDLLLQQVGRYEKLVVVKVDPVGDALLSPVITRCNPGSAADVSEWNGNPTKLERQHQTGFVSPMENAFHELMEASGASRSPVLESVQSVALSELQAPDLEGKKLRLIVASDLLQNTDRVSFYSGLPDLDAFIDSQAFARVRTNLRGVDVELWMLQRDDSQQTQPRALIDFWATIIEEQGGQVARAYRVSG
tara:strand:+ start:1228 stop:2058 length:831 start_codon:yes stop_codon:yes gene_type:complete